MQIDLPRSHEAPADARRFIDEHFGSRLTPEAAADVRITVSELVTNAILHGTGRVRLNADVRDDSLLVEVVDQGTGKAAAIREQGDGDGGGWGLRIVDTVARRWGAFEGTTHVWAELRTR